MLPSTNTTSDTDLVFRLTVIDKKNATGIDDTKVTIKHVPPPNQSPIANVGHNQTVNPGDVVTLDGGGSTRPRW